MIGFKKKKVKSKSRKRKQKLKRKYLRYGVFAVFCYLVFLIVTFPASIIASFVKSNPQLNRQVQITAVDGTIWSGSAANVRVSSVNLGQLKWNLKVLPLLLAEAVLDIKFNDKTVTGLNTSGSGIVSVSLSGDLTVKNFTGAFSADSLAPLMYGMPARFGGDINLHIDEMLLVQGQRINLKSRIVVSKARLISPQKIDYGDILIKATPKDSGTQLALTDQGGGPLILDGNVRLNGNGSYSVNLGLGARNSASADLVNGLRFIGGRRDSAGKYRYRTNGKLRNW